MARQQPPRHAAALISVGLCFTTPTLALRNRRGKKADSGAISVFGVAEFRRVCEEGFAIARIRPNHPRLGMKHFDPAATFGCYIVY